VHEDLASCNVYRMEVTQILQNALCGDPSLQRSAEELLRNAEEANFAQYMGTLCTELHTENRPPETRKLAGLLMKNSLDAKDRRTKQSYKERWLMKVDDLAREEIKRMLMETLVSPVKDANKTAAMVIAKVAAIELPARKWDKLVDTLLANVTNDGSPVPLLEGTLDSLGYLCEEAAEDERDAEILISHSYQILFAVITGMKYSRADMESSLLVRRAGVNALLNALEFVKDNFARPEQKTEILQTICTSATMSQPNDVIIRKTSFECLVKIAELYYDTLDDIIMSHIFELTVTAIRQDEEVVALQAIEFWSTIAEEELRLVDEVNPTSRLNHFIPKASEHLCPVIFECLMQQEELQDDDTWNKATAAGTCLDLLAECAPNQILKHVIPFVEKNIADETNWRAREAAIMAFGSILEGPSVEQINPLVEKALPVMLMLLQRDESVQVRDTSAWTIGRICHRSMEHVSKFLKELVHALLQALRDEPQVAKNVCWAVHNLAEIFEDDVDSVSGALSEYAEPIIAALLETTNRPDSDEFNLRPSAYEALSMILQYIPQGNVGLVSKCVPVLIDKLQNSLQNPGLTAEDQAIAADTQGLICGALQIATQRLKGVGVAPFADRMMQCFQHVLNQGRSASVSEEVLMAIGSLADALEQDFVKYIESTMPFLIYGLRSHDQYQVCSVAVGVVGDLCRAVKRQISPYSEQIVLYLLQALGSDELDKSVKPPMLSCLGDIAMAIGGEFEKYFSHVMVMLKTAAEKATHSNVAPDDYDMIDWILQLRSSIFEAYTGIFQVVLH